MEIVFIRHGQTDVNQQNRMQGALIDAELNEEGRKNAKEAAAHFKPDQFAAVYSSPLKRALETAQIFVKGIKEIKIDRRLLEFDFGSWDGKSVADIRENFPDVLDPWGKMDERYRKYAPDGETYHNFEKRCASFLEDVYQKYPQQKVLVVAHGRLIRMMAAHYLANGDIDKFDTMKNCALAKFGVRQGKVRLFYYNRVLI